MFSIPTCGRPFFILVVSIISGCSVYKSPDRKDFDSLVVTQSFQNLKVVSCSPASVRDYATETTLLSPNASPNDLPNILLWQYKIDDEYFIESDNLEGAYCLYENI